MNRCRSISICEFDNETDSVHKVELRSSACTYLKTLQLRLVNQLNLIFKKSCKIIKRRIALDIAKFYHPTANKLGNLLG